MKRFSQRYRDAPFWLAALLVYAFLLGPILAVVLASFEQGQTYHFAFPPENFSVEWYGKIPERYWHALSVSCIVAAVSALLATLLGAAAAIGLVRGGLRGSELLQSYFRLPLQIPFIVTGVVFLQFYNQLAIATGLDLLGTMTGLVLAHVFVTIPYSVGSVGSVLVRTNPQLEEAARTLGATEWAIFRRVLLPALRPGLFAGFFYAFIVSFGDVPISIFLASGKSTTLPVEIFATLQFDFDPAILALSTLVVVFSALMIFAAQKLAGFDLVLPSTKR